MKMNQIFQIEGNLERIKMGKRRKQVQRDGRGMSQRRRGVPYHWRYTPTHIPGGKGINSRGREDQRRSRLPRGGNQSRWMEEV
jgi:hypothetical protein